MYAASVYAYFTRVAYVYTWYHGILVTIDSYAVFALRFRVGCRLDVGGIDTSSAGLLVLLFLLLILL